MTEHVPHLPFSLDPLMAEAKRRARQRRLLASVVALVLAAGAAGFGVELSSQGSHPDVGAVPTSLKVVATNQFGGHAVFHLRCDPASGNVPDPVKACAAISAQPSLVTKPKPFLCWATAWRFTILGRMNGRPVHTKVLSCWTPQMALIGKLGLGLR